MDETNFLFHLPLFMISNGFERLFKCVILMDYNIEKKSYPNDKRFFKKELDKVVSGHELISLLNKVKKIFIQKNEDLSLNQDFESDFKYVENDFVPIRLMEILSEFATDKRYKNLNILLGSNEGTYNSPEDDFISLLKKIKSATFKDVSDENYNLFKLSIREVFIATVKVARLLSNYFLYYAFNKMSYRYIHEAMTFLEYMGDPILDLELYKRI